MMSKGLGSNVDKGKGIAFDLNLKPDDEDEVPRLDCSICLDPLRPKNNDRTLVKLSCQHEFHLDCIGSAFNAIHKMQCPDCKNVEKGQWFASGIPFRGFGIYGGFGVYDPMDQEFYDDEEEEYEQEVPGLHFGPINLVPPTMPIGLPFGGGNGMATTPLCGLSYPRSFGGNGMDIGPWLCPFRQSLFGGNRIAPWLFPYDPNQFLYDGFFDEFMNRDFAWENEVFQYHMDQRLASIAAYERDFHPMRSYGGGESSRSGVTSTSLSGGVSTSCGGGGSSYGGGGSGESGGGSSSGGVGSGDNGRVCSKCGRSS